MDNMHLSVLKLGYCSGNGSGLQAMQLQSVPFGPSEWSSQARPGREEMRK